MALSNHLIKLEKILDKTEKKLPVCIAGAMACPPDDCGGIWEFQDFKENVNNPKHP